MRWWPLNNLDLARDWTQNFTHQMQNSYRKLRTAFAKWAFGGDSATALYKKGDNSSPHEYRLPCLDVRDYLAAQQPTYLPQLADFADLILLTRPSCRPTRRSWPRRPT